MSGGTWPLVTTVVLGLAAVAAAGCDAPRAMSGGCTNVSGGACTEQLDLIGRRHPGAVSVDLTCTVPACDRRGGSGTAVVTMRDGSRLNDTFAYVGDPTPLPPPTCVGMAPDICRSVTASHADTVAPSRRIVALQAACTGAACNATQGEATVTVTFADGSMEQSGSSWSGGPP